MSNSLTMESRQEMINIVLMATPVSKSQYYSKFHAKRPAGSIDCQAKENTAPVSTVLLIQHVGIDHRKKTIDSPNLRAYVRGTVILV